MGPRTKRRSVEDTTLYTVRLVGGGVSHSSCKVRRKQCADVCIYLELIMICLYQYAWYRYESLLPIIPSDSLQHIDLAKYAHYVIKVNFIGVLFIRL
jgi:hypothetical protein